MINLPLSDWWLPLLGFIPIAVAFFNVRKQKRITKESWFEFIVGALVLLVSINDNMNDNTDHKHNLKSLNLLNSEINKLQDTLVTTRDTLIKVGIGIDEKTGRLLVMDSQLLKKEFTKVFNANYYTTPISEMPKVASEEFTNSTSFNIKLAHIPLIGTESYYINGQLISSTHWNRTGTIVKFSGFGYLIETDDIITAKYSYQ